MAMNEKITFGVFADLHYKKGMYIPSVEDLKSVFRFSKENQAEFVSVLRDHAEIRMQQRFSLQMPVNGIGQFRSLIQKAESIFCWHKHPFTVHFRTETAFAVTDVCQFKINMFEFFHAAGKSLSGCNIELKSMISSLISGIGFNIV